MPNSKRFKDLQKRLRELRKHFLPSKFSPTGIYTDRQLDSARAYRLLVHAEIEAFLEEISREAVIKKITEWKKTRKPSDLIICFLANYHSGWHDLEEGELYNLLMKEGTQAKSKDSAEEAVDAAATQYINKINNNHGVRIKDLKLMILPVGVRMSELDPTWLTNLDEFGKLRGDIAHNTVRVSAVRVIDPQFELQRVEQLVIGLKKLDEIILKKR